MLSGLRLNGKLQNIQEKEYLNNEGVTKTSYVLWVAIEGGKQSIQTNQKLELKENKHYSFPVGTNAFEYPDRETGELKKGVGLYLKKDTIEEL